MFGLWKFIAGLNKCLSVLKVSGFFWENEMAGPYGYVKYKQESKARTKHCKPQGRVIYRYSCDWALRDCWPARALLKRRKNTSLSFMLRGVVSKRKGRTGSTGNSL